ncbi:MAG TPA: ATP-binding protein [Bacillota bacterium]|nr:ATP-binding protein [Bacillota bacterium]
MRRRLMLSFLLTVCVAILIVSTFLVFFARQHHIKDAETHILNHAKILRNQLSDVYVELASYEEQGVSNPFNEDKTLVENLVNLSNETGLRITLMDEKGNVFADTGVETSQGDYEIMGPHDTRPEVVQAIEQGVGISVRYSKTMEADMIYCALPITDSENQILGILRVSLPLKLIEKRLSQNWPVFAGVVLTALAVAFAVALVQSKNLSKPIELMSQMAQEMAQGSFDKHLVPKTGTELDQLAQLLNSLASSLDLYISELRKSNVKMKTILDNSISGIILASADGKISSMNLSASKILGYSSQDSEGMPLHAVVRNLEICDLFEKALTEGSVQKKEIKLYYPSEMILDVTALPLVTSSSTSYDLSAAAELRQQFVPDGVLIILYDLTRLRRLETARRDFVQNISHELRTPITIIKGFAETLAEVPPDDKETIEEMAGFITTEVSRLSALVENLLELASLESGNVQFEPKWINGTAVICETVRKMEPIAAEKGQIISVEKDFDLDLTPISETPETPGSPCGEGQLEPVKVYADPSMFETVVSNLLDNALKYSGQGAHITVSLHDLRNEAGPGGVVLVVSDTGPGISEEDLERIFERFYRSSKDRSRSRGGSGLGLSLVKHCVNMHGGKVWAESTPGKKTSFFAWFPDPQNQA